MSELNTRHSFLNGSCTVCPTRYRTRHFFSNWLAGRPLLRVATIKRTTDTHYGHIPLHFSHNERTPVQISLQYQNAGFGSEWDTLYNLLKTKGNLLYIRNQSVPRCKHFPQRL
jgi:hypothetical protein